MRVYAPIAALALIFAARAGHAEVELKNDTFTSGETVPIQIGFRDTDIGAARFVAPDAGRQLIKVQFLFAGATTMRTITLRVWDDTAGTNAPGAEVFNGDYTITGSNTAIQEINLAADNVVVPMQFRVGFEFQGCGTDTDCGPPSLGNDLDGIAADKNYIKDVTVGWQRATFFGVQGDWIIRAFVSGEGGSTGGDGGMTVTSCNGNPDCPAGQFCDLAAHTCTFECRADGDCGDGTCNSLGQCVGGSNDDGGGCCETNRAGHAGGLLLGLAVLLLIRRRRR